MAKFSRNILATFFLMASVGCLLLWWRSMSTWDVLIAPTALTHGRHATVVLSRGRVDVTVQSKEITAKHGLTRPGWSHEQTADVEFIQDWNEPLSYAGSFGQGRRSFYFPLWFPALIFGLASIGIMRVGRFTIRSALLVTTVVAALFGMVVIL